MSVPRRAVFAFVALAAGLLVVACNDRDSASPTPTPTVIFSQNPRDQEAEAQRWIGQVCPIARAFAARTGQFQATFQTIDMTKGPPTKDAVSKLFRELQGETIQYHRLFLAVGQPRLPGGAVLFDAFRNKFALEDRELKEAVDKIEKLIPSPQFQADLEKALAGERVESFAERLDTIAKEKPDVTFVLKALDQDRACAAWLYLQQTEVPPQPSAPAAPTPTRTP